MKKLIASTVIVCGLFGGAPVAQAVPCKWPAGATWCAPRDGDDPNSTRQAGDHLDRPSAKTDAADGSLPAIRFNIPGWKAPNPKTSAGDGKSPAIKFPR